LFCILLIGANVSGIKIKEILLALLAFLVLSLLARMASISLFGGILTGLLSGQADLAVQFSIAIAILITGLGIGKLITTRIHENMFAHALLVAGVAGIYKALRPDLSPLPFLLVGFFSLLNFSAILLGARLTRVQ
jgi:NAD/NADP transhydrogenase beta subunit